MTEMRRIFSKFLEEAALRPDLGRGFRAAIAFTASIVICHIMGRSNDAVFVAFTAQIIAIQDLRGAYRSRLMILTTMILVAAGSAFLGVMTGSSVIGATLAMGGIAIIAGVWRHFSTDYGPPLGVVSALLFLLGLEVPHHLESGLHLAGLVVIGGAGGTVLQIGFWLFRPQHALRYAVAETWVAASDLAGSMRPQLSSTPVEGTPNGISISDSERDLRAALDRTFVVLKTAGSKQSVSLITHLEEMRREVVHFSMRLISLNASLEPLLERSAFARNLPTVDSVLKTLGDAARSVAITLITHRSENFANSEIRLKRSQHLIRVLQEQVTHCESNVEITQFLATLREMEAALPKIGRRLGETIDHSVERVSVPRVLPDICNQSAKSIADGINPESQVDPVLLRYSARMAVLTMLSVAVYKGFHISHGYWIAFTVIVVLQPDYGSTRQKAAERIGGTLAGVLLGSALLWVKMPLFMLDACAGLTSFFFAYFVKRRYDIAVFFVTLLIILITETLGAVHLDFTITRLVSALIGGGMALAAALIFWPVWERAKFPALLAAAIRANAVFLESMSSQIGITNQTNPAPEDRIDPLLARRRAEVANSYAAASIKRLSAEPESRREDLERVAGLATYNQRITRAFTVLAVHTEDENVRNYRCSEAIQNLIIDIGTTLESLARCVETGQIGQSNEELSRNLNDLETLLSSVQFENETQQAVDKSDLIWTQLAKSVTEIRAMALALESEPTDVHSFQKVKFQASPSIS